MPALLKPLVDKIWLLSPFFSSWPFDPFWVLQTIDESLWTLCPLYALIGDSNEPLDLHLSLTKFSEQLLRIDFQPRRRRLQFSFRPFSRFILELCFGFQVFPAALNSFRGFIRFLMHRAHHNGCYIIVCLSYAIVTYIISVSLPIFHDNVPWLIQPHALGDILWEFEIFTWENHHQHLKGCCLIYRD